MKTINGYSKEDLLAVNVLTNFLCYYSEAGCKDLYKQMYDQFVNFKFKNEAEKEAILDYLKDLEEFLSAFYSVTGRTAR